VQALNIEPIPGARVRGSLVRRLYHDDGFVAVDLLMSLIRTPLGRDSCLLTPRRYGFAHVLGTGQAVGWCTCANCC